MSLTDREWRALPKTEKDRLRAIKHERWRREGRPQRNAKTAPTGCLAGTELKAMFSRLGFQEKANCRCRRHAKVMDERGCDWCEVHIDKIAGWLKLEWKRRMIGKVTPFPRQLAIAIIHRAIARARKKSGGMDGVNKG